jgi:ABC-type lipoprotein export system ATPase subunit
MIAPDTGSVLFAGLDTAKLLLDRRSTFRHENIGYVFQSFRLMAALSAEKNIRLSLELCRSGCEFRSSFSSNTNALHGRRHLETCRI